MSEVRNRAEDAKGRAKEAAGALTDDDDLKREGKLDQAAASVRDKADAAKDKVDDAIDSVKEKFRGTDRRRSGVRARYGSGSPAPRPAGRVFVGSTRGSNGQVGVARAAGVGARMGAAMKPEDRVASVPAASDLAGVAR